MASLMLLAYRVQKQLWKLLHSRTRGVKVMLFNDAGKILLVRNTYGASQLWVLPGGGVRPWERPAKAAEREVREELDCGVQGLTSVSTHFSVAEGKRDTIFLFEATISGSPNVDGIELAEARLFELESLPETLSPATARRLAERSGKRSADARW